MPIDAIFNLLLQLTGLTMLGLGFAHAYLDRLLGWQKDLQKLEPINRQIFWAHTIFLIGGIFLLGISCLSFAPALTARSTLGAVAAACFSLCWLSRLICQFVLFTGPVTGRPLLDNVLKSAGTGVWAFYTILFGALFCYQIGWISK